MNLKGSLVFLVLLLSAPFASFSQFEEAEMYAEMKGEEILNDTANVSDIYFYGITGKLGENEEKQVLPEVRITIVDLYGEAHQLSSSADFGFYQLELKFDNKYKIYFEYPEMYTKYLEVDTRDVIDIEQERGYLFPTNMTMIPAENFDVKAIYLKKPVGKAYYDRRLQMLNWDLNYTDKLNAEVEKIKSKRKKR